MTTRPSTESGPLNRINASSVHEALLLARTGVVYSLDSQWWRGMPGHPAHPRFDVITYRTPRGEQIHQDLDFLNPENNTVNYGFVSEMIMGTAHTGTHIDALCHVVCGDKHEWYGGHSVDEYLGDFGATNGDAATLPPIIARGVLLDIPRSMGLEHCAAHFPIGGKELQLAADSQGVELRPGDVVLVRTGQMRFWPDMEAMVVAVDSGVSIDGAEWLLAHEPLAVGADNVAFECAPSGLAGNPQPVHVKMLQQNGVPIFEWVQLEELAADRVYEFAFLALPLTIRGATGSMVRPVAIA